MDNRTFESLQRLVETYETTGVASVPALGAVRTSTGVMREANPNVGPQARNADPTTAKLILQATMELERAMLKARADLGRIFNALRPHADSNPQNQHLHMVLAVTQQAYELCQELEQSARTELRQAPH